MISRLLKNIDLFCSIKSLLQGSFAKETYVFREPTNRSHLISSEKDPTSTSHVVTRMCEPRHTLSYNLFRLIIHTTYDPKKILHPPWRSASHESTRHVVTCVSHATHSHKLCESCLIESVSSHNACHVSSKTELTFAVAQCRWHIYDTRRHANESATPHVQSYTMYFVSYYLSCFFKKISWLHPLWPSVIETYESDVVK